MTFLKRIRTQSNSVYEVTCQGEYWHFRCDSTYTGGYGEWFTNWLRVKPVDLVIGAPIVFLAHDEEHKWPRDSRRLITSPVIEILDIVNTEDEC